MTEQQKRQKHLLLGFLLSMGMMSFELKMTSITQFVEKLSLGSYPLVILAQAFFLFTITSWYLGLAKKIKRKFFWINLVFSISILLLNDLVPTGNSLYMAATLFLTSTLLLTGIDFVIQERANEQSTILTDSSFSVKMVIAFEVGNLLSASVGIFSMGD